MSANTVFYSYTGSTSVAISGSLTSANFPSGYNINNITQVDIGTTVTSIGDYAFWNATSLTSVTFKAGSTLTTIGIYAFRKAGITNFNIPNTVTTIGKFSFQETGITSIEIPNSVTDISGAFYQTSSLSSVTFEAGSTLTSIGEWTFRYSGLTSIIIPNSVTTIGDSAFRNTTSLASIEIPNSVTSIGYNAFNQTGLTTATVNYARLGTSHFPADIGAGQIIGGKIGVNIIGYNFPVNLTVFYTATDSSYVDISGSLTSGDLPFSVANITQVAIGNTVTSIGDNAFENATALTTFTFEADSSVATIGNYAFRLSGLTSIEIPNSVTSIGDNAFQNAESLTTFTFETGSTLTTIGVSAFRHTSFSSITIPNSVTSIGNYAFISVSSLTKIYCDWHLHTFLTDVSNILVNNFDISIHISNETNTTSGSFNTNDRFIPFNIFDMFDPSNAMPYLSTGYTDYNAINIEYATISSGGETGFSQNTTYTKNFDMNFNDKLIEGFRLRFHKQGNNSIHIDDITVTNNTTGKVISFTSEDNTINNVYNNTTERYARHSDKVGWLDGDNSPTVYPRYRWYNILSKNSTLKPVTVTVKRSSGSSGQTSADLLIQVSAHDRYSISGISSFLTLGGDINLNESGAILTFNNSEILGSNESASDLFYMQDEGDWVQGSMFTIMTSHTNSDGFHINLFKINYDGVDYIYNIENNDNYGTPGDSDATITNTVGWYDVGDSSYPTRRYFEPAGPGWNLFCSDITRKTWEDTKIDWKISDRVISKIYTLGGTHLNNSSSVNTNYWTDESSLTDADMIRPRTSYWVQLGGNS